MQENDLDSNTPANYLSGSGKQSDLREIAIIAAAELSRTSIYPRTEKALQRILKVAERGLQHG